MFFTGVPILVEGQQDVAFISTHLALRGRLDEFRRSGCHFVVGGGKTNLSRLYAIAQGLEVPAVLIFDADGDKKTPDNERDNRCLLKLCGHEDAGVFPLEPVWRPALVVWPREIGCAVAEELGEAWNAAKQRAREKHGLADDVNKKNALLISASLEELAEEGKFSALLEKRGGHQSFAGPFGILHPRRRPTSSDTFRRASGVHKGFTLVGAQVPEKTGTFLKAGGFDSRRLHHFPMLFQ